MTEMTGPGQRWPLAFFTPRAYDPSMRSSRVLSALFAACLVVAACGDDADNSKATSDSIKKQLEDAAKDLDNGDLPDGLPGSGDPDCPEQEAAVGRMRVANLAVKPDGSEVGPVDIYADGYGPDQGCEALIENLGFGDVSNYIEVPASPYADPPRGALSYWDAGVTERGTGFWKGATPSDGVEGTGDQETVILSGGLNSGDSNPSWTNIIELSHSDPERNVKPASPGQGLLLVSGSAALNMMEQVDDASGLTLSIDDRCPYSDDAKEANSGVGYMGGNGVPYTVTPGQHEIGIIVTEPGVGIGGEDCDGRTPSFTGTVEVAADEATAVYLGGTSPSTLTVYSARLDL